MTAPARRPMRRRFAVLALSLLAMTVALGPAGSALAADEPPAEATVGIAGGPANEAGPDDRSRFSYPVQPGQSVTDHYVVRNTGSVEQSVTVYGTDAYNTNDGAFALLETGQAPADAGGWISVEGQPTLQLTLAPAEQKVLTFTIAVPADARPGDHAAGLVVSSRSPDGQVVVDRRVATRVYVRVAGDLQPHLTISSISASQPLDLNPFTGATDVTLTVQNTGNVALGAELTARVKTWFGLSTGTSVREDVPELLPGTTREVTFRVPGVARLGYLQPSVTLRPVIATDALDPGTLDSVERQTSLVVLPWILVAAVVVVTVLVLLARWRRARLTRQAEEWVAYTQAQARRDALALPVDDEAGVTS